MHKELHLKIPAGRLKSIDQRLPDILCKFFIKEKGV